MTRKCPAYWPAIDVGTLSHEEWHALKKRVVREARADRARVMSGLLQRLFAGQRRSPMALSPGAVAHRPR